jgi:hypothetical protein
MSTIAEIEAAIENLPESQIEELIVWLEQRRPRRLDPANVERWLASARGAARLGVTTDEIMALTRGDE